MAIRTYTVGPGKLTFSNAATSIQSQVTAARVTTNAKRGDDLKVLSGESIPGESNYSFALEVTILQDIVAKGIIDFSWVNMGKTVDFAYTPNDNEFKGATITGRVVVDPISIGGNVGDRATSDFTWDIVGTPKFAPAPQV